MVYSKLLLETGGGIISEQQQEEQDHNGVHLLIGLGGTGIDCIAEIKKQVYACIKPDDPEAEVPTYQHIQFLAADADLWNDGLAVFDVNEIFDLSIRNVKEELKNKEKIERLRELDWLDPEKMDAESVGEMGTGGSRAVGRYLLMEHSDLFLNRVKKMIRDGKKGTGVGETYIHLFTGLSGGLGSGCFLDVCYLIRQAIVEEVGAAAKVFGYFFLPDVNLAKIPTSASLVREYIPKNGYAAMQELDYCMRLGENGGKFTQIYKGGKQIDWKEAPVDMCHLISATDIKKIVVKDAYQNAMKSAAQYILDCLTEDRTDPLKEMLGFAAKKMMPAEDCRKNGYNIGYAAIGTSCASVPRREINTYLAAKTFEKFSETRDHMPTENEIAKLAEKAKVSSINELLIEITKNAGSDLAPAPDYLDWAYTRDNTDKSLVKWYTDQKAERIGAQEKNAQSMQDEKNKGSLIGRICEEINACVIDLNRGPAYAYNVMRSAYKGNMLNLVDGLLEELRNKISQLEYNVYTQPQSRQAMYEQSRDIWRSEQNRNGLFGRPQRAYDAYIADMENYIRGQIELDGMERLKGVLENLKKQMESRATGYYQKFNRIMENLTETFKENLSSLNTAPKEVGLYAMPLVTIDEIRPKLDATVKEMNMPGLFKQFVQKFFDSPETWIEENEDKISKSVKKFFINDAFSQFANRSITEFLADKYNTTVDMEITEHLYNDYMIKLKERSQALFPVDASVWDISTSSEIAYISVPATAPVVINAAKKLAKQYPIEIKQNTFKDRIYMIRIRDTMPICAYANTEWYEKEYFEEEPKERHIYMGKGGSALFNNWNDLPALTPNSLIEEPAPARLQKMLDSSRSVYEEAKNVGLIDGNKIRRFSEKTLAEWESLKKEVLEVKENSESTREEMSFRLEQIKKDLISSVQKETIQYMDTGYSLPQGSTAVERIEEVIREDYFVSSPALHTLVRRELEKYYAVMEQIEKTESLNRNEFI